MESSTQSAQGRWIAVSVHANREHVAEENLLRQGFRVYLPKLLRRTRHARRVQDVLRPLFPGYLFVELPSDLGRWRPILSTYGVRTLIRCGDRPSFVDPGFIAALKGREIDGVIVRPDQPYAVGDGVRLAGGAFDGLAATIIGLDEKERLVVLMELLGQQVRLRVGADQVRPLAV